MIIKLPKFMNSSPSIRDLIELQRFIMNNLEHMICEKYVWFPKIDYSGSRVFWLTKVKYIECLSYKRFLDSDKKFPAYSSVPSLHDKSSIKVVRTYFIDDDDDDFFLVKRYIKDMYKGE